MFYIVQKLIGLTKKIWSFIIISGLIYQSIDLTKNYFEFEILNKLDVEIKPNLIPSISICIEKRFKYSDKELDEIFENKKRFKEIHSWFEKIRILISYKNNTATLPKNISVMAYSRNNTMCLTPLFKSPMKPIMENVAKIMFLIYGYRRAYIIFQHHKIPVQLTLNNEKIILKSHSKTNIGFYKRVRNLLPFPYSTNCYQYTSSSGYKSQKDCFFKYISQKELKICGYNYNWNRRFFNITEEKFQFTKYVNKCHFNINKERLKNLCKIDCEINEYSLKHVYYTMSAFPYVTIMELYLDNTYIIHTTYVPKINWIEYLSTFGGLLSMWIGFSVWHSIKNFYDNSGILPCKPNILRKIFIQKNKNKLLNLLKIIFKSIILFVTFYQIYLLINDYIFSNKQKIISKKDEVYYPKIFIHFSDFKVSLKEYLNYFPEYEKRLKYIKRKKDLTNLLEFRVFSMMSDNLTALMELLHLDKIFIEGEIEYKDKTVRFSKQKIYFHQFYSNSHQRPHIYIELFPPEFDSFFVNNIEKIQKIVIRLSVDEVHEVSRLWLTRSIIQYLSNYEFRQQIITRKTNNFIF